MFPHDQVVHSQLEFCMVTVSPSQGLTARDRERLLLLIGDVCFDHPDKQLSSVSAVCYH